LGDENLNYNPYIVIARILMIFWKPIYSFNAQFLKGIIQASESASRQHLIIPKKWHDPKRAYWFEEIMAKH